MRVAGTPACHPVHVFPEEPEPLVSHPEQGLIADTGDDRHPVPLRLIEADVPVVEFSMPGSGGIEYRLEPLLTAGVEAELPLSCMVEVEIGARMAIRALSPGLLRISWPGPRVHPGGRWEQPYDAL